MTKILLASQSPRRQALFKDCAFDFEVVKLEVEEDFPDNLMAESIALFLAEKKADSFEKLLHQDEILVTADTIVWVENLVLNKPQNKEDATNMLQLLSGKTHMVFTGVCMRSPTKKHSFYEATKVTFKELTAVEIDYYLDTWQPYDKAGSYGVQDWMGYIGVTRIEGCFYNVMGFPMSRFYTELEKFK